MIFIRPANARSVDRRLGGLEKLVPSFAEDRMTKVDDFTSGYRHDNYSMNLGRGDELFSRCVDGLKSWRAHRMAWIHVLPDNAVLHEGAVVIVAIGPSWLAIAAPCRVTKVVDLSELFSFTYATLPGHPEQGEETFLITRSADGEIRFEISARSRPSSLLARSSGSIGRGIQVRVSRGYLRALRRFVQD